MKSILKMLMSESRSVSMVRLMALLSCLTAITIAFIGISKPIPDYSGLSILCGTFLSTAFAGKVIQKRIEVSEPKVDKA